MNINAWAAFESKGVLKPHHFESKSPEGFEVLIKVSHCGICHSDLHLVDGDFGPVSFPFVPGHEIVGTVIEKGALVKHLALGQRVGVGWQAESCMTCEYCASGQENLCGAQKATCKHGQGGGFADHHLADSRFAFPIPDSLPSAEAAPLLCGGITVYAPLKRFCVKPNLKVGIVGIGGLGHLALQFAAKMGHEVTAFSSSPDKEAEAKSLGASFFIDSRNAQSMKAAAKSLDFILSTVSANLEWADYMKCLRPNGTLCFVGVTGGDIKIPTGLLLGGQRAVTGSAIGGRADIADMLSFAARHQVKAQIESLPFDQVNKAFEKVRRNGPRYRLVLENQ